MLITVIKALLVVMTVYIFITIVRGNMKDVGEDRLTLKQGIAVGVSQVLAWFLATFGVSDTAVNLVLYRKSGLVDTRRLAPTIVSGALVPLAIMSFAYLSKVQVDPVTVVFLIVMQCVGGFMGGVLVGKLKIQTIRSIMSAALLAASFFLFAKVFFLNLEGGMATGLSGIPLVFAGVMLALMQALVMLGFANTIPSMSLLLMLGLSPLAVYPLIMTSGFFGCATGCIKVLRDGNYHRRISLIEAICGTAGVLLAVNLVAGMNLMILQVMMILLMLYSSYAMFKDNLDEKKKEALHQ